MRHHETGVEAAVTGQERRQLACRCNSSATYINLEIIVHCSSAMQHGASKFAKFITGDGAAGGSVNLDLRPYMGSIQVTTKKTRRALTRGRTDHLLDNSDVRTQVHVQDEATNSAASATVGHFSA